MTGPEHYREAEKILAEFCYGSFVEHSDADAALAMASAQVHATLALAAASGLNDAEQGFMVEDLHNWRDVASILPEATS